jgi:hypothetical protein
MVAAGLRPVVVLLRTNTRLEPGRPPVRWTQKVSLPSIGLENLH